MPKGKIQYSSRHRKQLYTRKNQNILPDTEKRLYTKKRKKNPVFFFHTQKKKLYTKKTLALE
jgi:hypothetical protein